MISFNTESPQTNAIAPRLHAVAAALALALTSPVSANTNVSGDFFVQGPGTVTYVIDGDTMIIKPDAQESWATLKRHAEAAQSDYQRNLNISSTFNAQDITFRVRIGNIDTAESVHPDAHKNTAAGKSAAAFAKNLIEGKQVHFACWDIGYYGRAICSVWTPEKDFATAMITANHAKYIKKYGRHPFWHDHYEALAGRESKN